MSEQEVFPLQWQEGKRVFRGEQSSATASSLPSKGLLGSIVNRKTASYTVTPPSARKQLQRPPVVPRPTDLTIRGLSSSHSSTSPRSMKVFNSEADCSSNQQDEYVSSNSILKRQGSFSSFSASAESPRDSGRGSYSSLAPSSHSPSPSTNKPLSSIEALVKLSCNMLLVPDVGLKRSTSFVSPSSRPPLCPNYHQRSNSSSCSSPGAVTPTQDANYADYSNIVDGRCSSANNRSTEVGSVNSVHSEHIDPSSALKRSRSYTEKLGLIGRDLSNAEPGNCPKQEFSTASLGRPVNKRHHLSLQDNVSQYKSWLKG